MNTLRFGLPEEAHHADESRLIGEVARRSSAINRSKEGEHVKYLIRDVVALTLSGFSTAAVFGR